MIQISNPHFLVQTKGHDIELSKHIWYLEENLTKFNLTERILKHAASLNPISNRCKPCLWEKYLPVYLHFEHWGGWLNTRNSSMPCQRHYKPLSFPKLQWHWLLLCSVASQPFQFFLVFRVRALAILSFQECVLNWINILIAKDNNTQINCIWDFMVNRFTTFWCDFLAVSFVVVFFRL